MKQAIITLLIGASAGLVAFVGALNNSRRVKQVRAAARRPGPAASSSLDFRYYPGEPKGYAGYTDHIAMLQTITDDLVGRDAEWQFRRIGFAEGFLGTVLLRAGDSEGAPGIFRMTDVTEDDAAAIGWIALMQTEGTDNALPSTSNLKSIVCGIASELVSTGPCRSKFWSETRDDREENPEEDGLASERLRELMNIMKNAERRGASLAAGAQIMPLASGRPRVSGVTGDQV
ncbi:hypothetical protein [Burkholderia sp. BCC1993]|uniref:hypothetical protein n=1 Tax=Burkholderia sp. BCC1993 TaxID=2817444 RepID=UPI002AAFC8A7|nr:hypothetical protein [Burkholderia sp. BCC1993]